VGIPDDSHLGTGQALPTWGCPGIPQVAGTHKGPMRGAHVVPAQVGVSGFAGIIPCGQNVVCPGGSHMGFIPGLKK